MNKYALLIVVFLIPLKAYTQEEDFHTIFHQRENKNVKISGFGGPIMAFTSINNEFTHMMGGGAALLIGNFYFGGYGMGKTNKTVYKTFEDSNPRVLMNFSHGGLMFGYIIAPKFPIHLSITTLTGWGRVSQKLDDDFYDSEEMKTDPVFVLTPVVELEFNFSRFFKLGLGSSCSYLNGPGISNTSYTTEDFLKPSVFLSFKFGWFR